MDLMRPKPKELFVRVRVVVDLEEVTSLDTVLSESLDESTWVTVVTTSGALAAFVGVGTDMAETDSLGGAGRTASIVPEREGLRPAASSSMLMLSSALSATTWSEFSDEA